LAQKKPNIVMLMTDAAAFGPRLPVRTFSFHGECRRVTGRRAEEKKTTRMTQSRTWGAAGRPLLR